MIKPLPHPPPGAPPFPAPPAAGESSAPDSAWIGAAVEQFESPLTQYATRLLSGDMERARDVVQDTFLKLWTADRAALDGHLGQWLYRVCRNRALDVRRKERRMTALQDEQLEAAGTPTTRPRGAGGDEDENTAQAGETPGAAVMALLSTLNDTQQEALRLKFQGGLSYKEIASVLDITSNHVGVLIHNAIKALRERMAAARPERQQGRVEIGRAQA